MQTVKFISSHLQGPSIAILDDEPQHQILGVAPAAQDFVRDLAHEVIMLQALGQHRLQRLPVLLQVKELVRLPLCWQAVHIEAVSGHKSSSITKF